MSFKIHSGDGVLTRPSAGDRVQVTTSQQPRKDAGSPEQEALSVHRSHSTDGGSPLSEWFAATSKACVWLYTKTRMQPRTSALFYGASPSMNS